MSSTLAPCTRFSLIAKLSVEYNILCIMYIILYIFRISYVRENIKHVYLHLFRCEVQLDIIMYAVLKYKIFVYRYGRIVRIWMIIIIAFGLPQKLFKTQPLQMLVYIIMI